MESTHVDIKDSFVRWDKNNHLSNIEKLGRFRYTREIVFSNCESCNAQRFIEMALSHGGLQAGIRADRDEIIPYLTAFKKKIMDIYGDNEFEICFLLSYAYWYKIISGGIYNMNNAYCYETIIGKITIVENGVGIIRVNFGEQIPENTNVLKLHC